MTWSSSRDQGHAPLASLRYQNLPAEGASKLLKSFSIYFCMPSNGCVLQAIFCFESIFDCLLVHSQKAARLPSASQAASAMMPGEGAKPR